MNLLGYCLTAIHLAFVISLPPRAPIALLAIAAAVIAVLRAVPLHFGSMLFCLNGVEKNGSNLVVQLFGFQLLVCLLVCLFVCLVGWLVVFFCFFILSVKN